MPGLPESEAIWSAPRSRAMSASPCSISRRRAAASATFLRMPPFTFRAPDPPFRVAESDRRRGGDLGCPGEGVAQVVGPDGVVGGALCPVAELEGDALAVGGRNPAVGESALQLGAVGGVGLPQPLIDVVERLHGGE